MLRTELNGVRANRSIARTAARRAGINPHIFLRQMNLEAHFQDLTSPAGAQGPAQIMPSTATSWGVHNVHDPHEAYQAAANHMATYLRQYGGSWAKALTAYNAGPGAVGGILPAETQHYIATILHGSADHIETRHMRGHGSATLNGRLGQVVGGQTPRLIPGGETIDKRGAMVDALLHHRGTDLLGRYLQLVQSGTYTTTTKPQVVPGKGPKYLQGQKVSATVGTSSPKARGVVDPRHITKLKGTDTFEGVKVAAWIAPILRWARAHGWTGKVTSGYRSYQQQYNIYYVQHIRPAAVPGTSNHEGSEFPRGAVDVSNAAELSSVLQKSPYAHLLIYAGSKDPVHFSHPHAGGY